MERRNQSDSNPYNINIYYINFFVIVIVKLFTESMRFERMKKILN